MKRKGEAEHVRDCECQFDSLDFPHPVASTINIIHFEVPVKNTI